MAAAVMSACGVDGPNCRAVAATQKESGNESPQSNKPGGFVNALVNHRG
jgi:hypothetical protein